MNAVSPGLDVLPGLPRQDGAPVFSAPWEAQAFALAVALQRQGLFTWGEWADLLGQAIRTARQAGDPDTGATYYLHWLATLEQMVARKGIAASDVLARHREAWRHAAARTPHGSPIELRDADFEG